MSPNVRIGLDFSGETPLASLWGVAILCQIPDSFACHEIKTAEALTLVLASDVWQLGYSARGPRPRDAPRRCLRSMATGGFWGMISWLVSGQSNIFNGCLVNHSGNSYTYSWQNGCWTDPAHLKRWFSLHQLVVSLDGPATSYGDGDDGKQDAMGFTYFYPEKAQDLWADCQVMFVVILFMI